MALNAVTLKAAIEVRMTEEGFDLTNEFCKADEFVTILCEEIVSHITSFAVVNSNVAVVSVAGVTVGSGVSGAGAGTAVGTIS
jgi:hypothetical protein